jgi:hypothetical protein
MARPSRVPLAIIIPIVKIIIYFYIKLSEIYSLTMFAVRGVLIYVHNSVGT